MRVKKTVLFIGCLLLLIGLVIAEESTNETTIIITNTEMNTSSNSNSTLNYTSDNDSMETTSENSSENTTLIFQNTTAVSNNITTNTSNESSIISQKNESNVEIKGNLEIKGIDLIALLPDTFNVGDVQFSLELQNNGTIPLKNVAGLVSGKGFSTYNIVPIPLLEPKQTGYVIVMGSFKEDGEIPLTIKSDEFMFKFNVTVADPNKATKTAQDIEEKEQKKEMLSNLTSTLDQLEQKYRNFEQAYYQKKKEKYDINEINLADLKAFLTNARTSILKEDLMSANAGINLAQNEYLFQKNKLDKAQIIEESFSQTLKNNAVLISSIAGAIIMLFTLYELLKKKKESLKKVIDVNIKLSKGDKKEDKKIIKKNKGKKEDQSNMDVNDLKPDDDLLNEDNKHEENNG